MADHSGQRQRTAALRAEAAAQFSTAATDNFMIRRLSLEETEFVSSQHHDGRECAAACVLTVATVAN
jgi:hypothetical protein